MSSQLVAEAAQYSLKALAIQCKSRSSLHPSAYSRVGLYDHVLKKVQFLN